MENFGINRIKPSVKKYLSKPLINVSEMITIIGNMLALPFIFIIGHLV